MSERKPKDGGPAFPATVFATRGPGLPAIQVPTPGMSLRDHLAALALPAIITATSAGQHIPIMQPGEDHIRFAIARDAYALADAMLVVREQKP